MPNELRSLRVDLGLPAKDMVAVVQEIYPKYDKTMQSKCENGDDYGISIRPDAMKALYEKFAPGGTKASRRKKDRHRLTGRTPAVWRTPIWRRCNSAWRRTDMPPPRSF